MSQVVNLKRSLLGAFFWERELRLKRNDASKEAELGESQNFGRIEYAYSMMARARPV